ncbi:hypothetical protein GO755_26360 [Spirosoma sp. HMF4905]|uniref:Uncharacterized protein n=1 Tax=Spirosoma arboris TaxID=2682092 RepID=A0A7K1SID9_9BACT|nr:hypothetical protein [Spirosoma arboris]MVM33589.1 hypothetical protein [Spirosoma arboris]
MIKLVATAVAAIPFHRELPSPGRSVNPNMFYRFAFWASLFKRKASLYEDHRNGNGNSKKKSYGK